MMLRTLPRSSRRAAGFTLIELLVAVALLAILAVLSWRGLDAVIQSRERLVTESDELRSLTLALAQLEEDLLGTWPVKNLGGGIRGKLPVSPGTALPGWRMIRPFPLWAFRSRGKFCGPGQDLPLHSNRCLLISAPMAASRGVLRALRPVCRTRQTGGSRGWNCLLGACCGPGAAAPAVTVPRVPSPWNKLWQFPRC